jgi:ATP-dependent DNA helicase RecG
MIAKDRIEILLRDIENERVERTISTKDTDKFAKAVCAFANDLPNKRQPGYLLIGVFDDGRLNGLEVTDELLRNLAGLRSDGNIQPKPALMVEKFSFPNGDIAVVEVQPSKNTPVKYKGVTYVRIGARKSEANEEEERILREKSEVKSSTFDTTPCLQSTINDLNLNLFKTEYLPKILDNRILKNDRRTVKQQLAAFKLFDMVHDCPTVAGILLTGKDPSHILFGAYIQYVKFAGTTRISKVLNERQFSGNILTLLKELEYFIKYTIQTQRPVFVSVLREEIRINYPYEAIRELAMNLVMHRNYQTNAPAKFYEYSDRIEMDNPGNLYGRVSPDNFPNENDYRNPVIADAMKAFGYVNRFSRGINMVQEELVENKNGLAIFDFRDITTFKVIVMNADPENTGEKVNVKQTDLQIKKTDYSIDNYMNLSVRENNIYENEANENAKKETKTTQKQYGNNTETTQKRYPKNNTVKIYKQHSNNTERISGTQHRNNTETTQKRYPENNTEKISGNQEKIVKYILENPYMTSAELSSLIGITADNVRVNIAKLKVKGILERVGSDKKGYWKIKNRLQA